jgi:hypothetical protein
MERPTPNGGLNDERFAAMDEKFDHLSSETRAIRGELLGLREEMHDGFSGLRKEMHDDLAVLHTEMSTAWSQVFVLHRSVLALLGGALVVLIGLIAALVAQL